MNPSTLATTRPLCACGCGQRIEPSDPSPFWASEACLKKWTREYHRSTAKVDYAGIAGQAKKIAAGLKGRLT